MASHFKGNSFYSKPPLITSGLILLCFFELDFLEF